MYWRFIFLVLGPKLVIVSGVQGREAFFLEEVMELFGVPAMPDPQAGAGTEKPEDVLNLGAWFQKGWTTAGSIGEKGTDFVAGMFDRFREADALGYDNDGDNANEN
ncbi:MAG: hypothetical protein ABI556_15065 [Gemmatimonadales bacterium]